MYQSTQVDLLWQKTPSPYRSPNLRRREPRASRCCLTNSAHPLGSYDSITRSPAHNSLFGQDAFYQQICSTYSATTQRLDDVATLTVARYREIGTLDPPCKFHHSSFVHTSTSLTISIDSSSTSSGIRELSATIMNEFPVPRTPDPGVQMSFW
jgi:hypothetical protein